jgi:hypothetical protein
LKGKISLCQSWFGVDRSKKRGFEGLRGDFRFTGAISFSRCSVRLTVSRLTGRKSIRFRKWATFCTP